MGLLRREQRARLAGAATAAGTRAYTQRWGAALDRGHYSDFRGGLKLSALGLGTFPGAATDAVDRSLADIVHKGLLNGLNVIDTAAHYRYGRSLKAVAQGLGRARADGLQRDMVWLMSKGGFVSFPDGPPADVAAFVREAIVGRGLASAEECTDAHVLSPTYLRAQIEDSRAGLGVETLDAFLVDQPEVHIPSRGKAAVVAKLGEVFTALEEAVAEGVIRYYGVSSFHAFRVATDDSWFLSLASLVALAEKAAKAVTGSETDHHFALIEMPFNAVMLEGFTRFNQITGDDSEASTLQAALRLKLYTVASHGLFKGHLAREPVEILTQALPRFANPAQRALQFNRSTPGLGTTLVGMSDPAHLDDMLAVARAPLLSHSAYMGLFDRTE